MSGIPDRATVQMACVSCNTDALGDGVALLKVPTGGRKINGGMGWFLAPNPGDTVKVFVSDEDNILGYGAGAIVAGYTDTGVPAANQGWYLPPGLPLVIERLVDFGTLNAGLYLKLVVKKGDGSVDTFRANIHWGKLG